MIKGGFEFRVSGSGFRMMFCATPHGRQVARNARRPLLESHRFELGENVSDENVSLDAQRDPLVIV